jgi:predicted metal-binding protein
VSTPARSLASILVCDGCCCGHTEKGNPELPRKHLESIWSERGLESSVRLRFVDCLGPCETANLAVIKTPQESLWLAGLTTADDYEALAGWAARSTENGAPAALTEPLAKLRIPPHQPD